MDEVLMVAWRQDGEPDLLEILKQAATKGLPVDIVEGNAPGWADPWARAARGMVTALGEELVEMTWDGQRWYVDRFAIQAVKIVETDGTSRS